MPEKMRLAFDLSYAHMEGRWRLPGSWINRTYPDGDIFEEIAKTRRARLYRRDFLRRRHWHSRQLARIAGRSRRGGFMLTHPIATPRDFHNHRLLIQELQRRGRFKSRYQGKTLRENLTLK
jgi:hypothetical protein